MRDQPTPTASVSALTMTVQRSLEELLRMLTEHERATGEDPDVRRIISELVRAERRVREAKRVMARIGL